MNTKKVHCPSCYYTFTLKSIKSIFQKNKILCPSCRKWVDIKDKISNKMERPLQKIPKWFSYWKSYKTKNPKYIPCSLLSEKRKPDVLHFCKPDFYKYDMFRATGKNI